MEDILVSSFEKRHRFLKEVIAQFSGFYKTSCDEQVDDIIQEVLVKLWMNWRRYHRVPEKELRWVIYTITRNYIINTIKKRKNFIKHYPEFDNDHTPYIYHDKVLLDEGLMVYKKAVQQLTPAQKRVFAFFENDSRWDEVADTLHVTRHTLRNHLSSALFVIRSYLNNHWDLNVELRRRKKMRTVELN